MNMAMDMNRGTNTNKDMDKARDMVDVYRVGRSIVD
jgi:hypothetical protein